MFKNERSLFLLLFTIFVSVFLLFGCGGSGSDSSEVSAIADEGGSISLTGSTAIPVVSPSISKAMSMDESPSSTPCTSVKVYQMTTGNLVAQGTCNEDSTFTLYADPPEMRGEADDETGEESFKFRAAIMVDDFYGYAEASVVVAETTTVDLGAITLDSTISFMNVLSKFGITDFSISRDPTKADEESVPDLASTLAGIDPTALSSFNPGCAYRIDEDFIRYAKNSESGVGQTYGHARGDCREYWENFDSPPARYSNWGEFMRGCMNGELTDDELRALVVYLDLPIASEEDILALINSYSVGAEAFRGITPIIMDNVAAGEGLRVDSQSGSTLCEQVSNDDSVALALIGTISNADSVDDLNDAFVGEMGYFSLQTMLQMGSQARELGDGMETVFHPRGFLSFIKEVSALGGYEGMFNNVDGAAKFLYEVGKAVNGEIVTDDEKMRFYSSTAVALHDHPSYVVSDFAEQRAGTYVTSWMGSKDGDGSFVHQEITNDQAMPCIQGCMSAVGATYEGCASQCVQYLPVPPNRRPSPKQNGEPCAMNVECLSDICLGGMCDGGGGPNPPPPPPPKANGEPCEVNVECLSGLCSGGLCDGGGGPPPPPPPPPPKANGEPCEVNTECLSGLCAGGICAQPGPFAGNYAVTTNCPGGLGAFPNAVAIGGAGPTYSGMNGGLMFTWNNGQCTNPSIIARDAIFSCDVQGPGNPGTLVIYSINPQGPSDGPCDRVFTKQ